MPLREQAIPPVVYQTARNRVVDDEQADEMIRFRNLNPDLSFIFFDDEGVETYMANHWGSSRIYDIYRRVQFPQMRSDIFRYCLLFDRGGYYFDFNKAAFLRLTELHKPDNHALVSFERNECIIFPDLGVASMLAHPHKVVIQWGFGFAPGHRILQLAIDRVVELEEYFLDKEFAQVREAVFTFTGPGLFTWAVRQYLSEDGAEGMAQAGVDWNGQGMFRLRGSHRRPEKPEHYASAKNRKILVSERL